MAYGVCGGVTDRSGTFCCIVLDAAVSFNSFGSNYMTLVLTRFLGDLLRMG
jgi:hypothetical protein